MNNNSETTALSRKDRERLQHRREIIEAAIHLFAQNGYEQTKLEDVAALAEFGKGTIYNHFENKIDLFVSSIETVLDDIKDYTEARLKEVTGFEERLQVMVDAHFDLLRRNADFVRMFIAQHRMITQDLPDEYKPILMRRYIVMHEHLLQGIKEAQSAGWIRPGDPDRYATYLLGMVHSQIRAINMGLTTLDEVDPKEIIQVFLQGVRS